MGDVERLYELQVLDTAIDQLGHRRVQLPSRAALASARAESSALEVQRSDNRRRRDAIEQEYAAIERTGTDIDAKVDRLQRQLRNVVVTREAEAIQREIATLRAERDERDEHGLALLDEAEQLVTADAGLADRLEAARAIEESARTALAADDLVLDTEKAALQDQRDAIIKNLQPTLVAEYQRLRPSFNGVAVARLEGTQCTGCHLVLSRVEIEAVRAVPEDGRAECPQCARLLAR